MRTPLEHNNPSPIATAYWTGGLIAVIATVLGFEVFALATGHPENTLSNWVWTHLKIRLGETITQWSAGDLLTFSVYVSVFVLWLPWHFWLGKFR